MIKKFISLVDTEVSARVIDVGGSRSITYNHSRSRKLNSGRSGENWVHCSLRFFDTLYQDIWSSVCKYEGIHANHLIPQCSWNYRQPIKHYHLKVIVWKKNLLFVLSWPKKRKQQAACIYKRLIKITKDNTMLSTFITNNSKFHVHHQIQCVARGVVDTLYLKVSFWYSNDASQICV